MAGSVRAVKKEAERDLGASDGRAGATADPGLRFLLPAERLAEKHIKPRQQR